MFLVSQLDSNADALRINPDLDHRVVDVFVYDDRLRRRYFKQNAILLVEKIGGQFQFNIQDLAEEDLSDPSWIFSGCRLNDFVFKGDAYEKVSFSSATNLTNADFSQIEVEVISFDNSVILNGFKFPANVLKNNVLKGSESQKKVIAQLGKTYHSQGGVSIHRRLSFFRFNVNEVVQEYKERAKKNPGKASELMLKSHGFIK